MPMDPELKERVELAEAEDAFIAAKVNREKDPNTYRKAKERLSTLRTAHRRKRESAAGTAAPESINVKTKGN